MALKSAIISAKCLTHLDIGECLLDVDGTKVLFKALKDNCPLLKELHISANDIEGSKKMTKTILAGLANKEHLELVNFMENEIDKDVQQQLSEAMPHVTWQFGSEEKEEDEDDILEPPPPSFSSAIPSFPSGFPTMAAKSVDEENKDSSIFKPINLFSNK